ncbi:MAG: AMP nucleosidase [Alphaproteobacteria bacterium 41-28]|nr:MAG: AMP nucleosidase [Alphaproteobacteria bacterium 41-28]
MKNSKSPLFEGHGNVKGLTEFWDPAEAVAHITKIYNKNVALIRNTFLDIAESKKLPRRLPKVENATYPYLGITVTSQNLNIDHLIAFGAALESGTYGTTLTRPDIFHSYYEQQIELLINHHKTPVVVGESDWPIPLPFVDEWDSVTFHPEKLWQSPIMFALPNLSVVDDSIVNGTYKVKKGQPLPLALFTGERVDFSLGRLHHYCGTSAKHFQNFILLTNYQRYINEFVEYAHKCLKESDEYLALVEPGDYITPNPRLQNEQIQGVKSSLLPQMPAYHLKKKNHQGITFINIGVGPTNAKTITDHLAVLRPHCWLMLGHCAGLRRSQRLGDYVLAHAYVREDQVLNEDLPTWVPVPPIAEIQTALQQAVGNITGEKGMNLKDRMRTGTVVSTDNRNWELRSQVMMERFRQSRAIALDMESATISANGFRMRVPYGTLLCVSDKPIHGELKLRGMAYNFYQQSVSQHLHIGIETIRILQEELNKGDVVIHSRKLRNFDEPPFR